MKNSTHAKQSPPKNTAKLLAEKDLLLEEKSSIIDKKSEVIAGQKKRIAFLEECLRLERARFYGRSSEKTDYQGELFDETELCCDEEDEPLPEIASKQAPAKKGRRGLSKDLPRDHIHHRLSEEEKEGAIDTFFTVVKEELDIVPAKARVIVHHQEKAVFLEQGTRVLKSADLPKHPLGKGIASVNLLAHIITSKYCDGLPLYRQEAILARYGGSVTRTSMAKWMMQLAQQFQGLINLLREHQLSYDYLQIDETRIKVLKEPGASPTTDKWMWVTRGGPPDAPVVLFDYDPSRGKEVPVRLLEGYSGYLQSDGYAGYSAVCTENNLNHLGCWDHARRKFKDAEKAAGNLKKRKDGAAPKYAIALAKINKLYALEREFKVLCDSDRKIQRQQKSKPLLDSLHQWLEKNLGKVPKGGKTHIAMQYTLNQWSKLTVYCEDGRLHISNVLAENAIRPFVIGRKGWLFADTPKGAHASATHYALIETAKANGLEPFSYLQEVLAKLPYAERVEDLEALLPWNIVSAPKNSE